MPTEIQAGKLITKSSEVLIIADYNNREQSLNAIFE